VYGQIVSPKGNRPREAPLSADTIAVLRALKARSTSEVVFANRHGRYIDRHNINPMIKKAAKLARLRPIGWHTMRHSFASHLVMRGVSLKTVQELMGHSNIRETLRYSHITPAARRAAVELLDGPSPVSERRGERVDERPVEAAA
jgi:site-specific recombinase XerD